MLGEVTHLQAIVDDLTVLTEDPHKLPPASEQVTMWQLFLLISAVKRLNRFNQINHSVAAD